MHKSHNRKPSNKRTVSMAPDVKSPSASSSRTSIKRQPSTVLPHIHRSPSHASHNHSHRSDNDHHHQEEEEEEDLTEYINQLEDQNRLLQTRVRSLTKKQSIFANQPSAIPTAIHSYSDRITELEHLPLPRATRAPHRRAHSQAAREGPRAG